ncbi:MAG: acyl carrier protein [Firmicutes bacterium]|jgi:acyl carrier protein|nr:acyl carrier protein [Bacillota bacterium]MDY5586321.1 acyl carrier protein [Eubacteriales bacterium]
MTIDKVKELLAAQLNISKDKIQDDSKLVEDLGADSLDMVEMLMTLEDEFGVSISDEDALNLKTVADIVSYIEK